MTTEQESNTHQTVRTEDRIRFTQLAAYGAGGIIPIALFNIAGILVGLMGNISLGLSAFWLGAILIIPRLWDALSDPVIGHLSDNTRTRWGRRRPYLLFGGIAVALFFVAIWWIPKGDLVRVWFPTESGFQWFQLGYILLTLLFFFTACNIFEIPHGALGMEMTSDYHERTRLFSAKSFVGNLFAMSTPWLFALASMEIFRGPGGNEADGMRYVSLMIAAILIPLSFWWFFRLREPGFIKAAKHEKTPFWHDMKQTARNRNFIMLTLTIFTLAMGFNFVQLLGSYIPIFYVFGGDKVAGAYLLGINGTIWAITGLLAVFPLNWISPKLGKRNTLLIAIALMSLAQLSKIVCYNPEYPYLIVIPTILLSAGMLFFFTLGSSMVGDICDEDELKTGYRSEGSYYSVFWWFIKMGSALASFVAGALIVLTLFDETQVTKVDKLQGSIREMRSEIRFWKENGDTTKLMESRIESIRSHLSTSLDEVNDFQKYLGQEMDKMKAEKVEGPGDYQSKKIILLKELSASTQSVKFSLQKFSPEAFTENTTITVAQYKDLETAVIPVTLQSLQCRARLYSFELMAHLQSKEEETGRSKEHYKLLVEDIKNIDQILTGLNIFSTPAMVDTKLEEVERRMVPLTRQTPYTLLMMRVVEIGLPLLLSIFTVIFALRYSLTERRSHEIKALLKQRNEERPNQ